MTDQRPQYGELATPEEQRRAASLPPLEEVAVAPAAPPVAPAVITAQDATASSARPHPVDRLVTLALLAYGLVNIVITGLSYLDLPTVLNQTMTILGIEGEFTNFAQGRVWGPSPRWCSRSAGRSPLRCRSGGCAAVASRGGCRSSARSRP
ncbi:DUF6264 family protein [Microbacterium sp. Se63.02b]|uniref:DUF6264 family protein n=1 Tax=Microbacterium sp. Se63.02b TaxID=2709304 RepID=UPI001FCEADF6|nr:DUF6264 family protein [Microbacterium sp. Se63.02b]